MAASEVSLPAGFPAAAALDLLPTGVVYCRPVLNAAGAVVDFTFAYLNPAAQRQLRLPAQPARSYAQQYAVRPQPDGLAALRAAWRAGGEPVPCAWPLLAEGQGPVVEAMAHRLAEGLLISFAPAASPPQPVGQGSSPAGPGPEPAAQAELPTKGAAPAPPAFLQQVMGQMPAAIATLTGPEHRYAFFNDAYQALAAGRTALGLPVAEVFPEVVEQGFIALLDQVYATGQPFSGSGTPAMLHDAATGRAEQRYVDFTYQPLFDEQRQIQGILAFILDVTERVRTRKQAATLEAAMLAVAQRQAQQRQDLYRLYEQAPTAIVLLRGADHRIDYFNPAFQQLFPPQEWAGPLHGHTLAEVYPPVQPAGLMTLLDRVFNTGQGRTVSEMPLTGLQPGSLRYLTFSYQPYREQDRIVGVAAFAYDVTEQVQARQQRDARQAELQRVFEQVPVAITIMRGPSLVVELANTTMLAIWGRAASQVLGRPYFEAVPDTAGQGFEELLGQVLATGQSLPITEAPAHLDRAHTGQPTLGYFNFLFQPLYDERQQVSGLIAIGTEVTEQVLLRQQAEANVRELRLLTDALPVLIGYLDRALIYRFTNRAYQEWFGQEPGALLGQTMRQVVGEVAYQVVQPYIERALAGERVEFEARMPYRPDFIRYIRASFIPDAPAGTVTGFYTLVSDVTEQVLAREQVQELNKTLAATNQELQATNEALGKANSQLRRTNADLDTFVYSASHDLKSPITNVEGLLMALRAHLPANAFEVAPVPRLLDMMGGAVARFQQTLTHLTDISRLQQVIDGQPAEEVNLPALVEDVRLDILPEITAAHATLRVDLAECRSVRFSPKNLRSIIYNLFSNAIKYRSPSRPLLVQLRGRRVPGLVVLEVQDNGLGLDAEQQAELFRMFRRLHNHVPGSGVGLYMVKKMVENAGGTIAVASQPEVGTTFTVSLPDAG